MGFINSRSFQKNNPEVFEIRKQCYKANYKVLIIFFSFIYFTFTCATISSFLNHEIPLGAHNPIPFEDYPLAFYPFYVVFAWSMTISALLGIKISFNAGLNISIEY